MKQKVIAGLFWKLLENGGSQGIQFLVAILLARLLTRAEYGTVGIIMIFITIANVIVQNGFSTALIQRQKADETDFSSVFYFSLGAAFVMYGLLWVLAPWIAKFYDIRELSDIVRVLALVLFPGAVISVQTAWVSRQMEFKGLFLSTFAASVVSGIISVFMAYRGHGGAAAGLLCMPDGGPVCHRHLEAGFFICLEKHPTAFGVWMEAFGGVPY